MKKYVYIIASALMLAAFSCIASAEKITVQPEASHERQIEHSIKSNEAKEKRLSSKRIMDRVGSHSEDFKGTDKDRMTQYRQFYDGEGEVKIKK